MIIVPQDAYLLATLLGHPKTTKQTLTRALAIFDEIRRPAALKIAEKSRLNGQYFTFKVDGLNFDRLRGQQQWDKLQLLGNTFTKNWEWAWTTSVMGSVEQATRKLELS